MFNTGTLFRSVWGCVFVAGLLTAAVAQSPLSTPAPVVGNQVYFLRWSRESVRDFSYVLRAGGQAIKVQLPVFEINNQTVPVMLTGLRPVAQPVLLKNNGMLYTLEGDVSGYRGLHMRIEYQLSSDNPVLRFRYRLLADPRYRLTKKIKVDHIRYLQMQADTMNLTEIALSDYDERVHATHLSERVVGQRYFEDSQSVMGPILAGTVKRTPFLISYEHGSQYGDRFLEFQLRPPGRISIDAVKGNYLSGEPAGNFNSPWFELAMVPGNMDMLAASYRQFILHHLSSNSESRKPYLFYNTWGRQEKKHFQEGAAYLSTANLSQTMKEIDRAHAMGIEVYVIDVGWFNLTGDWEVNTTAFPDTLQAVKRKLASYGMKLGLWFNPTMAAVSSRAYASNVANRMSWNDSIPPPAMVWESPPSSGLCLVSNYWEQFADRLIELVKTLGVSYFKWDGIAQYGCNDAHHLHGGPENTAEERAQRYAFLQPLYLSKIIDKVVAACPGVIVDFDITEPGRSVGLEFLSSGKYFLLNNGPYFHNFDLSPTWQSPLADGNTNIFVHPGPARGWFLRSVLDYDRWIPSNLFLAHYLADGSAASQKINIASLILGQNGVWGDILSLSDTAVTAFARTIDQYKQVRDDMEEAPMIRTGSPGQSPEIYEKINPATERGAVILITNQSGEYDYITQYAADKNFQVSGNASIFRDSKGRAVIHFHMEGASAAMIFFGAETSGGIKK